MTEPKNLKPSESEEFLIENLWILENESGICIFEQNYKDFTKEGVSTDLIAGFLSAIISFAGETFTEEIQHIKFQNRKLILEFTNHVLFVIAIGENSNDFQTKIMIDQIAKQFYQKFGHFFEQDQWSGGDISPFNSFSEDLEKIIKRKPLPIKILQAIDVKTKIGDFLSRRRETLLKRMEILESRVNQGKNLLKLDKKLKR